MAYTPCQSNEQQWERQGEVLARWSLQIHFMCLILLDVNMPTWIWRQPRWSDIKNSTWCSVCNWPGEMRPYLSCKCMELSQMNDNECKRNRQHGTMYYRLPDHILEHVKYSNVQRYQRQICPLETPMETLIFFVCLGVRDTGSPYHWSYLPFPKGASKVGWCGDEIPRTGWNSVVFHGLWRPREQFMCRLWLSRSRTAHFGLNRWGGARAEPRERWRQGRCAWIFSSEGTCSKNQHAVTAVTYHSFDSCGYEVFSFSRFLFQQSIMLMLEPGQSEIGRWSPDPDSDRKPHPKTSAEILRYDRRADKWCYSGTIICLEMFGMGLRDSDRYKFSSSVSRADWATGHFLCSSTTVAIWNIQNGILTLALATQPQDFSIWSPKSHHLFTCLTCLTFWDWI